MDLATILGIVIAIGAITGGNALEGGHLSSLIQPTAFIIVAGGTIGAVFVCFPLGDLIKALKDVKIVLFPPKEDMVQVIKDIANYSNMARRNGILALQPLINESTDDPFKNKVH